MNMQCPFCEQGARKDEKHGGVSVIMHSKRTTKDAGQKEILRFQVRTMVWMNCIVQCSITSFQRFLPHCGIYMCVWVGGGGDVLVHT